MFTRREFIKLSLYSTSLLIGDKAFTDDMRRKKSSALEGTPKADGFYFPAEWQPHDYTIMQFVPRQNWAGYGLDDARREWATVANAVSGFESVLMIVESRDKAIARKLLSTDIELLELPMNDGWARDSGPLFLVNDAGERRMAGFTFNGWGGKFPPYDDDAELRSRLCTELDIPFYEAPLVLEGGAITLDGEGTLITTEECLLNKNRNPNKTRAEIENILKDYLGVHKVVWLKQGIVPDPITDGHVDGICVFVAPATIMLHTTSDRSDPNYGICETAKQILLSESDANGKQLDIIELPLALNVAHINFYFANDGVIVPLADDKRQDDTPLSIIRDTFPERKVVGISARTLAKGGGGVHCITQQVPKTIG